MAAMAAPLVLASASPRRREILTRLGIAFRVEPSGVDEAMEPGEAPLAYVERAACAKALEVAGRIAADERGAAVLGADTIVVVDGDVLGKPTDDDDARRILRRLVDRWHEVTTAVALARAGSGLVAKTSVTTRVRFRACDDAEIDGYVATGEGRDKAGAYAVQGIGEGLVSEIAGSYGTVVGLPAVETIAMLRAHGVLGSWP